MKKVSLTNTGIIVPAIGLGTANFGKAVSPETAMSLMDKWASEGLSLIDTAHVYGGAVDPDMISPSEKVIGEWIHLHGKRQDIVLCTKGCHPKLSFTQNGPELGPPRLQPEDITHDLDISLQTLQTDYIDMYFLHRDDPATPVSVIIDALEEKVKEGKIRYYGASNWTTARLEEAAVYASSKGAKGFTCNQLLASLAAFSKPFISYTDMLCLDEETFNYQKRTQMGVMTAMSMANGFFQKRLKGADVSGFTYMPYLGAKNDAILEKLKETEAAGISTTAVIYAFLTSMPFPTVPLFGFSRMEQMEDLLQAAEETVPADVLAELTALRGDGVL